MSDTEVYIDWSKAPEGANCCSTDEYPEDYCWEKIEYGTDMVYYWRYGKWELLDGGRSFPYQLLPAGTTKPATNKVDVLQERVQELEQAIRDHKLRCDMAGIAISRDHILWAIIKEKQQ